MALVAARYMFDGPSVIAGRLPALICCLSSIDMADRRVLVMMDNWHPLSDLMVFETPSSFAIFSFDGVKLYRHQPDAIRVSYFFYVNAACRMPGPTFSRSTCQKKKLLVPPLSFITVVSLCCLSPIWTERGSRIIYSCRLYLVYACHLHVFLLNEWRDTNMSSFGH